MPIGVTSAGNTALLNRGTENHVVRLSDDPKAENILAPGNDGYVASDGTTGEHYDDQLAMFENFEYKQLLFDDADIESATAETRSCRGQKFSWCCYGTRRRVTALRQTRILWRAARQLPKERETAPRPRQTPGRTSGRLYHTHWGHRGTRDCACVAVQTGRQHQLVTTAPGSVSDRTR